MHGSNSSCVAWTNDYFQYQLVSVSKWVRRMYHTVCGSLEHAIMGIGRMLVSYQCQRSAFQALMLLDRSGGREQLFMVCAWQVSSRGGSDRRGQLHMVHGWEVSNWIRSLWSTVVMWGIHANFQYQMHCIYFNEAMTCVKMTGTSSFITVIEYIHTWFFAIHA